MSLSESLFSMSSPSPQPDPPRPPMAMIPYFFGYVPSIAASIAFLVVFACASLLVLIPTIQYRRGSYIMLIVVATGIWECIGFGVRTWLAVHADDVTISPVDTYIFMTSCLIISPNALALVNYVIVSRLLFLVNTKKSLESTINHSDRDTSFSCIIQPKYVTPLFLASDLSAFTIQGSASSMSSDPTKTDLVTTLMTGSIVIQLIFFTFFLCIVATIQFHPTYKAFHSTISGLPRVLRCIWCTMILLYARAIFRLAEFATGSDGPVETNETASYVCEATPIFLCFLCYYWDHFGLIGEEYLNAVAGYFPETNSSKENETPHSNGLSRPLMRV